MHNPLNNELKKLQKLWYDKLKKDGFNDIEAKDKWQWHSVYFEQRHDILTIETTTEYYRRCTHLLHSHNFQSKKEKDIWCLHSEGESIRNIARKLNLKIWLVHRTIQALQLLLKCSPKAN